MADEEREEQEVAPKTREGAEQAAALNKMTDNAEEREIKIGDTTKIKAAMAALAAAQLASQEAQRQKEKTLAAVKVNAEDIDLIAEEFELDKKAAERKLREASGDVKAAIEMLLQV